MSNRGLSRVKSISFRFCDWGDSSKGTREYLSSQEIYDLANTKEEINFVFNLERNKHPFVEVEYLNGLKKNVSLRNYSPELVKENITLLLNQCNFFL